MGMFDDMIDKALKDAQYEMDRRSFGGNIKESPFAGMSHAELSILRDKLMNTPRCRSRSRTP